MHDINWSKSEKQLARTVFDRALKAELQAVIDDFKTRAAAIKAPDDLRVLSDSLNEKRSHLFAVCRLH